jgi:hypothetical protein
MNHPFSGSFDSRQYFNQIFQQRPENFASMSFDDQSVWYFRTRYLRTQFRENLLETMREKLECDEEFLMSAVRLYAALEGEIFQCHGVWELYGHEKALFMASMDDVEANSDFFSNFQPFQHSSQIQPSRLQILELWAKTRSSKLRMAASTMKLIQEDWDQFEHCWRAAGGVDWTQSVEKNPPSDYPFLHGLKVLSSDLYDRVLLRESQRAIQFMSSLVYKFLDSHSTSGPIDQVNQTRSEICYLLAAAGSGKTHRMFNMLRRHFGFYLVSGAVRSEELPTDPGERLYRPRTSAACADTELLIRTVKQGLKGQQSAKSDMRSGNQMVFDHQCDLLLDSRLILFCTVLKYPKFQAQPWQWLRYQLSYNGDVRAFRSLFHCLILLGDMDRFGTRAHLYTPERLKTRNISWEEIEKNYQFLWCFDEVQYDTALVMASSAATSSVDTSIVLIDSTAFSSLMASLYTMRGWHSSVLAGTAMNLESVEEAVGEGILAAAFAHHLEYEAWTLPQTRSLDRSSLVSTDKDFENLLKPSIRSILEVVWNATSPQLPQVDLSCIRIKLGPSLVGNETVFEDHDFISRLHDKRRQGGLFANLDETQSADEMVN